MARTVKKPEERRREIVKAARFLFETKGYDQTSVQDIVDHLGVAKGTVYYYFRSKEDLLAAAIQDIAAEEVNQVFGLVQQAPGTALDRLRLLFHLIASARNVTANTAEMVEQLRRPGNFAMYARIFVNAMQRQAPLLAQLVQQGCEEGLFQTATPLEAVEIALAATELLLDRAMYPWTQDDLRRAVAAFPTLVETLFEAQPGALQFLSEYYATFLSQN